MSGAKVVLVVDDEPVVLALACAALRNAGFEVFASKDGYHALELLKQTPVHIDAAVLDFVMPGMNGPELLVQLQLILPSLFVLMTSGYSPESLRARGMNVPVGSGFLPKPYRSKQLVEAVQQLVLSGAKISSATLI
jgi:CheY-like chemotaxis protein